MNKAQSPRRPSWPPEHRCENCGWWGAHWLIRLFRLQGEMGRCTHPQVEDLTWKSFVCWRHTAGAWADLGPSLRARVEPPVAEGLKRK